jgi:hypothetical protein
VTSDSVIRPPKLGEAPPADPPEAMFHTALSVEAIVERFGGIRPMAAKLDVPVTTVQGWKERGAIPARRWPDIQLSAARHAISLDLDPPAHGASAHAAEAPHAPPSRPHAEPARASSVAAPAPRRRIGLWIAVAAVLLVAAYATFGERAGMPSWRAALDSLRGPAITGSVVTGAAPLPAAPATPPPPAEPAMAERLAALEARVSQSDAATIAVLKAENQRLASELETARAKLEALEGERARQGEARERARRLVMAWGHLRAALATDNPYESSLQLFEASTEDAELKAAVAPLAPNAAGGVPTRAKLIQRFEAMAPEVMRANAGAGEGFWSGVERRLSSLIVVRRTGARAPQGGAEGMLAAAEAALARGDLAGAVAALNLEGAASGAAAEWIAGAKGRLAVERALEAMDKRLLAVLATGEGGKRP